MKRCLTCLRDLSDTEFHRDRTKKDGLYTVCKECRKGITTKPIAIEGHRICKICLQSKKVEMFYKSDCATRRTCISCSEKRWNKSYINRSGRIGNGPKNLFGYLGASIKRAILRLNGETKEKDLASRRKYERSDKGKQARRAYRSNNSEKFQTYDNRRRTKKLGLETSFNHNDWIETLRAFNNKCAYCGTIDSKLAQDHYIPLSCGGPFKIGNIVPACKSCNSKKNNILPDYFLGPKKRLSIEHILKTLETFNERV